MDKKNIDIQNLRAVFELAKKARSRGNNPFAARLVSADNRLLLESENTQNSDNQVLAHAEMNLLYQAVQQFEEQLLRAATLYTSAEPCAMCSGAIFWSGVGRLVFGMSGERLHEIVGSSTDIIMTSSREILHSAARKVDIVGPLIENEVEHLFI